MNEAKRLAAITLRKSGLRNFEIAKELGLHFTTVSILLRGCGVPLPKMNRPQNAERQKVMAALYKSGRTLQEIGTQHGVTRERVRQLIERVGLNRSKGGEHVRTKKRAVERAAKKDERALKRWGCSWAQYCFLRSKNLDQPRYRAPLGAYSMQRRNAHTRNIPWKLNLWQWWSIWLESGKWGQRGRGQGYVMARHGNEGGYEQGNVSIVSATDNCGTGHKASRYGYPRGVRKKGGKFTAYRMLGGKQHYIGSFSSPEAAHAAYLAFKQPEVTRAYIESVQTARRIADRLERMTVGRVA